MTEKYKWWEKTVEYSFVRTIMNDNSIACPLAGKAEKWAGDLVESIENKFRLIEFKKDAGSIKDEDKKYGDGRTNYLVKFTDEIKNSNGAQSHWLVFGEFNTKLELKYRNYFANDGAESLSGTNDLCTSNLSDFKMYIDCLMELRGNSEGSFSGLVMADIGDGQSTVIELSEFIQLIPSLSIKLTQEKTLQKTRSLEMGR